MLQAPSTTLQPNADAPNASEDLESLAMWALSFTPRVATVGEHSVVMELSGSTRLFGGQCQLIQQVNAAAKRRRVVALSWAPNSLAALTLARCGICDGLGKPLPELLDPLPIHALTAATPHRATLLRLGCQTLGDVRALPRPGLYRRFSKSLLQALDTAYGMQPEHHIWKTAPTFFQRHLELMARAETAGALLHGARHLLAQLCDWLRCRRSGITAFTLIWQHDAVRHNTCQSEQITIHTSTALRNLAHLSRLLSEHLAKLRLLAPVEALELIATDIEALPETSSSLLEDGQTEGEAFHLVMERIAARLGEEKVLQPIALADHRLEWSTHWQSATLPAGRPLIAPSYAGNMPQPSFLLSQPRRLEAIGALPVYQGKLQLLSGPHRIESGWWHRAKTDSVQSSLVVNRDYWVASSEHAGVLWIFQTRLADENTTAWFLHGTFA